MKKNIFIFIIIIFIGLFSGRFINAQTPTGVYMGLNTNVNEVIPNDYVEVTLSIHNVSTIPIEEDGISLFMLYLYYDSSRFELPVARTSSTEAIITNEVKTLSPQFLEDGLLADDIICKYKLNNPDYLTIEIPYNYGTRKNFNTDGDLFTLRFKAISSGDADFYTTIDKDNVFSKVYTGTSNNEVNVDNTISRKTVNVVSTDTSIKSILVKDNNSNNLYTAVLKNGFYDVAVPATASNIDLIVNPKSEFTSIEGDGNKILDNGYGEYTVTLTAQDNITKKNIKVIVRTMKDICTLMEISLLNGQLTNGNNYVRVNNYDERIILDINYTNSITLLPIVTTGSNALVYYNNQISNTITINDLLVNEENNIELIVRAENGFERIYNITILINDSDDDLSLSSVTSDPDLSPIINDNEYIFNYPYSSSNNVKIYIKTKSIDSVVKFRNPSIKFNTIDEMYVSDYITIVPGISSIYELEVTSLKGDTKIYTFILNMESVDTESRLANIMINDEMLDGFSPDIYQYNLGTLPDSIKNLKITATPVSPLSEITGTGDEVILTYGPSTIIISVKSQNPLYGETSNITNYYLNYYREEKTNTCNIDKILINGELISNFDKDIKEYDISVDNEVSTVFIEAILNNDSLKATLSGNIGLNNLKIGKQQLKVKCISENSQYYVEYILNITRMALNNDTSLKSIFIDGKELVKDNDIYLIEVPFEKSHVNVEAIANYEYASINGTGLKSLNIGQNSIILTVFAEDKTIYENYEIKVIRKSPSNNSYLENLSIAEFANFGFSSEQKSYTFNVPWESLSLTLTCKTMDEKAIILPYSKSYVEFKYDLSYGINKITINVEAEDGSISTYTLIVNREVKYNNDSKLKELKIEGYEAFELMDNDENIVTFNIIVPYSQNSINIKAMPNSDKSLIVGANSQILSVGVNQIDILCYAEDKSFTTYRIFVFRESLSNDNYLTNIIIDEVPDFVFNQNVEQYFITLQDNIEELHINVEKSDENAKCDISGNQYIAKGMNKIEVKVTALDGSIRIYEIFVDIQNKSASTWLYAFISTTALSVGLTGTIIFKIIKRKRLN